MMLKHSRWSGRRLMPSGGGWMTPNPSGGVAACLVWNRDSQRPVACVASAAVTTARSNEPNEADDKAFIDTLTATYGDVNVATSVTVVPHQPTVVIAPTCTCCCSRHHLNTSPHSADSFVPPRPVATQHMRSSLQHWPVKAQRQDGGYCCNTGDCRQKHPNVDNANDDSKTAVASTANDDRRLRRTNVAASRDREAVVRRVDEERPTVRPAWTSAYSSRLVQNAKVDVATKHSAARSGDSQRLRILPTGNAAGSARRCTSARTSDRHAESDFATCTDQLTTNIYASLAAYQDHDHENDVIDAVRGYLRRQPSPARRRPTTGRRPATAADSAESRTVQLRQGDVGPLSNLVVIRPATPQVRTSRTNGGPVTAKDGQRGAASEAATVSDNSHRVSWRDSRHAALHQRNHCHNHQQQQQQQPQQFCIRTSSRTTETATAIYQPESINIDGPSWSP